MFGPLAAFPFLLAQAAAPAPNAAPTSVLEQLAPYAPFIPVLLLFYFMILRPGQQQERKKREMIDQLKKGDKVLTLAGMYGTVVEVDSAADRVTLKIDQDGKVRVVFTRAGIARVVNEGAEKK